MNLSSVRRRALAAATSLCVTLCVTPWVTGGLPAVPLAASASGKIRPPGKPVTVMTRNLYLGTGLLNTLGVSDFQQLVTAVTQDWNNVLATDYPTRAGALADEIVRARPDVVGLQEVELWREQTPSDIASPTPNPAPNATHVVFDFLTVLLTELAARGVPYTAASTSTNGDVEAPRVGGGPTGFVDVRLTDRDVILVRGERADKFVNADHGNYSARVVLRTLPGTSIPFPRGWTSIDCRHDARTTVRILHTHLEPDFTPETSAVQEDQGAEFLELVDQSNHPVVALGDFNSPASGLGTSTYESLTADLQDVWVTAHGSAPGLTCCQDELLTNATSVADRRIDLILASEAWPVDRVTVTGDVPFSSTAPRWASDHFGVTARITIPR